MGISKGVRPGMRRKAPVYNDVHQFRDDKVTKTSAHQKFTESHALHAPVVLFWYSWPRTQAAKEVRPEKRQYAPDVRGYVS